MAPTTSSFEACLERPRGPGPSGSERVGGSQAQSLITRTTAAWRAAGEQDPVPAAGVKAAALRLAIPLGAIQSSRIGSAGTWGAADRPTQRASWRQNAARMVRLSLRVFGGRQWSLPGLILRVLTLQVLIALVWQRKSWREALWGTPLCRPTDVRGLPSEQRDRLVETGARACTLVAAVHQLKNVWIDELRLHDYDLLDPQTLGIELEGTETWTHTCLYDPHTAFKAIVVHDRVQNEWVLVFGAQDCFKEPIPMTAPGGNISSRRQNVEPIASDAQAVAVPRAQSLGRLQIAMAIFNLLGGRGPLYNQAASLTARLQRVASERGVTVRCVGQSLGGSLATYAALRAQVPATVFNPLALGVGLQADLGEPCLQKGTEHIDVFTATSDWASDPHWLMRGLTEGLNLLGVRTAAVVGRQWLVPSAYDGASASHDYIVGTFSSNLETIRARQMGRAARDPQQVRRCRPSEIRPWNPAQIVTIPDHELPA